MPRRWPGTATWNTPGRDGSSPEERITRGGYRWRAAGQNLASGVMTAEEVVDGWLHSPELCSNLMYPLYREIGVACAVNAHDEAGAYGRWSSARRTQQPLRRASYSSPLR
jgi:uncharacterized protein YkwD